MSAAAESPARAENVSRLTRVTLQAGAAVDARGARLPDRVQVTGTLRRLYETALVLFGQRGFHAVSVRDLTRALGVQASTLYSHVPSKGRLLADLVRVGHEEHRDQLRWALLEVGAEPAEQVRALVRAHVLVHATYPLLTRVCNRDLAALPPEDAPAILAIRLDAEQIFVDVIERGQRLGDFRLSDPVLAVAALGAMGIRVAEWWSPGLELDPNEIADTYAEFAVRMLT